MKENQVGPADTTGTQERRGTAAGTQNYSAETSGAQKPQTLVATETREARTSAPAGTQKARRSGRVSKEIPILLIGSDSDGRVFTEEARTAVLSQHGAGIVSRHRLIPEQELILRCKGENRETVVRVVGEIAHQGERHTYGVAFADEKLDFWKMEFPPPPEWDERPLVLTLECGGCREEVELLNGDFEYDICAIHGGLTRYCEECGMLTVKGMKIQIAVPFAAEAREAPAIFVQGQIANVREMASQGMYQCGVEFLK